MRPASIVQFERLFLASIAAGAIGDALAFYGAMSSAKADALVAKFGFGTLIGGQIFLYAIALGLWYLIAHRHSVFAKWAVSVWFVLSTCSMALALFQGAFGLSLVTFFSAAAYLLRAWSVSYLFKPDADAWFARPAPPSAG